MKKRTTKNEEEKDHRYGSLRVGDLPGQKFLTNGFVWSFKTCRMFCFVSSFDTPDTSSIAMSALEFVFSIRICFSLEFGVSV